MYIEFDSLVTRFLQRCHRSKVNALFCECEMRSQNETTEDDIPNALTVVGKASIDKADMRIRTSRITSRLKRPLHVRYVL